MDYWAGTARGPVYEFPYSGQTTYRAPLSNYNADVPSFDNYPSLDNFLYQQPSVFQVYSRPPTRPANNNNTIVFQVPDNMSLDTVLRHLGVDLNTLQRSSTNYDYHTRPSTPIELNIPRRSTHRKSLVCRESSNSDIDGDRKGLSDGRRRLICQERPNFELDYDRRRSSGRPRRMTCREVSDSDSDTNRRRSSDRRGRRHHPNDSDSGSDLKNQRPNRIHNLLSSGLKKSKINKEDSPRSNSSTNMNTTWPAVPRGSPATQNTSPPARPPDPKNAFQAIVNASSPTQSPGTSSPWPTPQNNPPSSLPPNTNNPLLAMFGGGGSPPSQPAAPTAPWTQMPGNVPPPTNLPPGPMMGGGPPTQFPGAGSPWQPMGSNAPPPNPVGPNPFGQMPNSGMPPQPPGFNNPWQPMMGNAPPTQPPGLNNPWSPMQNNLPPQQLPDGPNQNAPTFFDRLFKRNPGSNPDGPPQQQPNPAAMNNPFAGRNMPPGFNQPNPGFPNAWGPSPNMPPQGPMLGPNPSFNPMMSQPPAMNNAWNLMSRG